MTRGAMRAIVQLKLRETKRKKKIKGFLFSFLFFLREKWAMRREVRERERERKSPPSLYDLQRSGDRLSMGQGLKWEYSVRATRGY